jgi:hypothetical protein
MVSESRRKAADHAWASSMLEGFNPTPEQTELWEKFVNEEISGDEYRRIVVERARAREHEKRMTSKRVA